MTSQFKDYFSDASSAYQRYRPDYPDALFAYLSSLCAKHELASDCATGSGQAAKALAFYFDQVVGTDASAKQLSHAYQDPKINYRCEPAEKVSFEDHSVDLVTVAQALHWFDLPKFYASVERVLKPTGIFAAWCYQNIETSEPLLQGMINKLYEDITGPYWPKERIHIDNAYRDLSFPFTSIETPSFVIKKNWTCTELLGYLGTWSGLKAAMKEGAKEKVEALFNEIIQAWPKGVKTLEFSWPIVLFVCHV